MQRQEELPGRGELARGEAISKGGEVIRSRTHGDAQDQKKVELRQRDEGGGGVAMGQVGVLEGEAARGSEGSWRIWQGERERWGDG
eukprot:6181007-Pleurochrysis_carterae.AAC.1